MATVRKESDQPNLLDTKPFETGIDFPRTIGQAADSFSERSKEECFELLKTPLGELLGNASSVFLDDADLPI